jgi:hypothetical protein
MLAPLAMAAPASSQFRCLIAFLEAHEAPIEDNASRLSRGRAAVHDVLAALAAAHATQDDPPMAIAELAASIRRVKGCDASACLGNWLTAEQAALCGDFDQIALVLTEGERPERPKRNAFYPVSLQPWLADEKDRRGAAEARFLRAAFGPPTTRGFRPSALTTKRW